MAIRIRRGTDAQRAITTFLDGEIIWTTDFKEFWIGDGVTVGGILIGPAFAGYVPITRTLTINGTTYDLSANRTWSVGTVTSVGATSPITSTGGTTPVISTSMSTNKLIGRSTAGTGVMEQISVGTGLSLSGGTLSATVQQVGFEQNFLLMGA